MEIISEPICQTVNTLKKLSHWLPIHSQTMTFDQLRAYVDGTLIEAHNKRLGFARDSDNCWCVYLDVTPVIMIIE